MTTPALDATVTKVLDRKRADSDDEDELLAELEREDSALDGFRERRLQQLHDEFARAATHRSGGGGTYLEVEDEKAVMDITTFASPRWVGGLGADGGGADVETTKIASSTSSMATSGGVRSSIHIWSC